jgi:hypothetical protein
VEVEGMGVEVEGMGAYLLVAEEDSMAREDTDWFDSVGNRKLHWDQLVLHLLQ